jgi:outer membrane protein
MFTFAQKTIATCVITGAAFFSTSAQASEAPTVGVVNFRQCLEDSKIGKAERGKFDDLRRQMEAVGESKESSLQNLTRKFNDPDYLDGLSPEAEIKAKDEYRQLTQDIAQLQQQYYQILNQANMRILQHVMEEVSGAATEVAKTHSLSLVLNEESSFYHIDALDVSSEVIRILDSRMDSGSISVSDLQKEFPIAG